MATKSYSKHKEYKEFKSSSNNVPYTDEQFDMLKTELLPSNSKLHSLDRNGGAREYHYEYKEEKHPSGKYDRKDMHTVEEYTIPPKTVPKASESNSYYYKREERDLPAINSSNATRTYNYESNINSTPGYSKVKSSKVTKDLSHNVEELDSLLDDLQKDQERQLYKSGYTSDTAESSSFDYKRGTPAKAPSSGYSTLKKEERLESSSWGSSPPPVTRSAELRQEMYREEKTESRVVPSQISPAVPQPVPAPVCVQCHHSTSNTLSRSSTPMNKVTTTVKTYTYEVPADQLPLTHEHTSYLSDHKTTTSATQVVPAVIPPSPSLGCQYCAHCSTRVTSHGPTTAHYQSITSSEDRTNERIVYPKPANDTKLLPLVEPHGHSPHVPTTYKYSETTYSSENTTERYPPSFPRAVTPLPVENSTPKKLDDLLADFPEARFPTETDGVRRRVEVSEVSKTSTLKPVSKNVSGPAVYYPPGHTPFQKKETPAAAYQASAMQGGGAYASGRGMYEYESGAKSKEKHSEKKTAVPLCLPLCCAMPCVIM